MPLLQAGATGCFSRDDSVGDLARALIAVGRGELVSPPAIAARALAGLACGEPVQEVLAEPLSERELEVLRLLARGLTNKDIAQTLIVSVRIVEAHLRSIFAKLDVVRRDPGCRVLLAVNVRYCHHMRHALRRHPEGALVRYSEL